MQPGEGTGEGARGAPSRLERIAGGIAYAGGWIGGLAIVAVLLITAAAVFGRYVLGQPLAGADDATGFLVVVIVMFGAAEALRRGDHIRIDLLFSKAGPRTLRWLEAWSLLGVLAFALLLAVTAWETVVFSRQFGAYSPGELAMPLWIPQSALLVGGLLLALAALAQLLRLLGRGRGGSR